MNVVRSIARPMLGWVFVYGGWDALRNPGKRGEVAAPVLDKVKAVVPGLPTDDDAIVRVNGGVQLVAGALLASGTLTRTSALVLAGSLVPTTLAGHPFWEVEEEAKRAMQRTQFNKNLAILGGLLLAAVDTEGRPSVSWWVRRAARRLPAVTSS